MLLVWFVIAAVPIGYLLKGRLRNYLNRPLKYVLLPIIAFSIEACFGKITELTGFSPRVWLPIAVSIEYLLLLIFMICNIRRLGVKTLTLATSLNLAVIASNGFRMPVLDIIYDMPSMATFVERIESGNIPEYVIIGREAPLWFLGDIIPIANGMASIGDFFIAIGMMLLVIHIMRTPAPQEK